MVGDSTEDAPERRVLLTDGGEDEESDESEDEEEETDEEAEEETDEEAEDEEDEEEGEDEEGEEDEDEGSTVLHLDLEGLFLNLLGLEVDLDEVELDVSAVPGEKRLVGNLLDAVAGLLDKPSLPDSPSLPDIGGKVNEAESKVTDEFREIGSEVWEDLDLAGLITDVLRGLVNELLGDSVDFSEGNESEGSETENEDEESEDETENEEEAEMEDEEE